MRRVTQQELDSILDAHEVHLMGSKDHELADLSNTDLSGLKIEGRDLKKVDLSGADLSDLTAISCSFNEARLSKACLNRASFTLCLFSRTNLINAFGKDTTFFACSFAKPAVAGLLLADPIFETCQLDPELDKSARLADSRSDKKTERLVRQEIDARTSKLNKKEGGDMTADKDLPEPEIRISRSPDGDYLYVPTICERSALTSYEYDIQVDIATGKFGGSVINSDGWSDLLPLEAETIAKEHGVYDRLRARQEELYQSPSLIKAMLAAQRERDAERRAEIELKEAGWVNYEPDHFVRSFMRGDQNFASYIEYNPETKAWETWVQDPTANLVLDVASKGDIEICKSLSEARAANKAMVEKVLSMSFEPARARSVEELAARGSAKAKAHNATLSANEPSTTIKR